MLRWTLLELKFQQNCSAVLASSSRAEEVEATVGERGGNGIQARRGGKLIHILFYSFILAHESKSCPPPPSAHLTANNIRHAFEATGGEGGGRCAETDTDPGIEDKFPALQFWSFPLELKKSKC